MEPEINELRRKLEALRKECQDFREVSGDALETLRQKGLALDAYMESVQQMLDVVDGMFLQPLEYMAMIWRIERNAYAKAPTLDEYLRLCEEEKNTNIGKKGKNFIM